MELSQRIQTAVPIESKPPVPSNGGSIYRFGAIRHTPYTNILQHSKAKKNILNNGRYTTNTPTVTTTYIKTNLRHTHTSIVSRYLATRGNNKMLRTPPPHISSTQEILPRLIRCTLAQLRTNESYLHKVDAKTHPSPLCPLCNTHTHTTHIISSTAPTVRTTLSTLDLWTDPARLSALLARWTEKLVDHKREDRTPHTSKGHGSG